MSIDSVAETASAALQAARLRCWLTDAPGSALELSRSRPADHEFTSDMRYSDTNDLINSLQTLDVDGLGLTELLRMDGASMWQFMPSYLWPDVFRAIELTKVVLEAVESLSPSALVALPCGDRYEMVWEQVSRSVARARGVDHSTGPTKRPWASRRPLALRPRGLAQAARKSRQRRRAAASRHWESAGSRKLLFATLARHWVEDPARPGRRYDEQLSPLLGSLTEAGWDSVLVVDCPYNAAPDIESIRERQEQTPDSVTWRSFNAHGGASVAERRRTANTCEAWKTVVAHGAASAGDALTFHGVEVGPALAEVLVEGAGAALRECAAMRAEADRMLEAEQPDAVMASYETGPYARSLLIEAARRRIPTVGLQHGMILDNHYDYMHVGVGPDPQRDPFTIPRRTCVWGPFWKRVLTEAGHYPEECVQVTGNWRHAHRPPLTDRAQAGRRALAVEDGRPLVLVCTAAQGTEALVSALGPLRDAIGAAELRIRPHPSENLDAIAAAYGRTGGNPAHVSREGELGDVLAASNLVVSQLSTVISEAVLADRPVIVADFDRQEGWSAYKDSDATLVAASEEELVAASASIDSDPELRERLRAGRTHLVDDFFDGRDGHAAERVVEALGD